MSDMSSLSHEYASTTDFSRHINDAVLLLKKQALGAAQFSGPELNRASELVRGIVCALLAELFDEEMDAGNVTVPEDILQRIEERHQGNLDYFRDDLASLAQGLASGKSLSLQQLELLDSICEAADASASATFRKLWRR
jgi:hypothetical protein